MHGFWGTLPKPFLIMAPMANVSDAAFRRMFAKYGKPDVMYTEFVSADGLMKGNRDVLLKDLMYTEGERPIVAQFFTGTPEMMEQVAKLAQDLGFDGVDINMGCPDRSVEKQGGGAALIKNAARAQELIYTAKAGAPNLPISVKTRLGYNKDTLEEWLPAILKAEPAHLTLHARTRKEMSLVPARWDRVKRAVEIRNEMGSKTLISGNGDVVNVADAYAKAKETGVDGVMIGRGIFGKPWLFSKSEPSLEEKLKIAIEHTKLFEELLGDVKNFAIMKKHFKAYVEGFKGAKELRVELMEAKNAAEIEKIITEFIKRV